MTRLSLRDCEKKASSVGRNNRFAHQTRTIVAIKMKEIDYGQHMQIPTRHPSKPGRGTAAANFSALLRPLNFDTWQHRSIVVHRWMQIKLFGWSEPRRPDPVLHKVRASTTEEEIDILRGCSFSKMNHIVMKFNCWASKDIKDTIFGNAELTVCHYWVCVLLRAETEAIRSDLFKSNYFFS